MTPGANALISNAIVVGGGIGGLSAARELARSGVRVRLLEGGPTVGGLARGFEMLGEPLERFYHHLLGGESDILELIDEYGMSDHFPWHRSSVGVLIDNKVWPFTSPIDLVRFTPLPLRERFRAGVGALRVARAADWRSLDRVRATEWLAKCTSENIVRVLWEPLLRAKFAANAADVPAAWMWARIQQRQGARTLSGERLAYPRGGFGVLFEHIEAELRDLGVDISTGARVRRLLLEDGRCTGVETEAGNIRADAVVYAGRLGNLADLVPVESADPRWLADEGLGAVCVIIDLPYQLSDIYWTNVLDGHLPFGGIIEHTNLVPSDWYRGRHIVYLSRYFNKTDPVASQPTDELIDEWLDALGRVFPHFRRADVGEAHAFRTPYAAPLVRMPYLPTIAPVRTHLPGLFATTMAQIYPQDRGMSEGLKRGRQAAQEVLGSAWSCPLCGGRDRRTQYEIPEHGSEGGVDPSLFRPSADRFGEALGDIVTCTACGHGSVDPVPTPALLATAYGDAQDEISLREEAGQIATADRALEEIEQFATRGALLDVGCWTGSFLVAARDRRWEVAGVEPSSWACGQAKERDLPVFLGMLEDVPLDRESFDAVVCCDVLEHVVAPSRTIDRFHEVLRPNGVLYLTAPDAGSRVARWLGRRWWSVLPMHVQYFTRDSMHELLEQHGFEVMHTDSHAKAFSVRYYLERLSEFAPALGRPLLWLAGDGTLAHRLVSPNFHDRMAIIARRT